MRYALVFIAVLSIACGGSKNAADGGPDAHVDGAVDCSLVGIGAPARCELGCLAACGCGSCGEGEIWDFGGQHRLCVGGCLALVPDGGIDAGTDAATDAATDTGTDAAMDAATDAATDASTDAGGVTHGGDTCGVAFDVTAGATLVGESTFDAVDNYSPPIGMGCPSGGAASGRDRVYVVAPSTSTTYRVTVTPAADFDPMLYLFTVCDFSSGCIDGTVLNGVGVPESLTFTATAGSIYIVVDGELASRGSYDLSVEIL